MLGVMLSSTSNDVESASNHKGKLVAQHVSNCADFAFMPPRPLVRDLEINIPHRYSSWNFIWHI
jgi:hypothetical protein